MRPQDVSHITLCMRVHVLTFLVLVLVACSPGELVEDGSVGAWTGTITTEGNVTTVVNESGSLWGGTAGLVEEVSIGVDAGADAYMLGSVADIAASGDKVYVLDNQVPVIRVYDRAGEWVTNIGRAGQGPGEFGEGFSGPVGLAIGPQGRLYVHNRDRVEVFSSDGEHLESWQLGAGRVLGSDFTIAAPESGVVVVAAYVPSEGFVAPWHRVVGLRTVRDGEVDGDVAPFPDLDYVTPYVEQSVVGGGMFGLTPTFVPALVWNVAPDGAVLIGRADRYEIERHRADGSTLIVSRTAEPVPVAADERAWHERIMRLQLARNEVESTRGYDFDAEGLPSTKPFFEQFIPTHDGGLLVVRAGPGRQHPECASDATELGAMREAPCWTDTYVIDAFAPDGRYLGAIEVPEVFYNRQFQKFGPTPYVGDNQVIAAVEDELGVISVKVFRLLTSQEVNR